MSGLVMTDDKQSIINTAYLSPTVFKCCPMRRTMSWLVSSIVTAAGPTSPLARASWPLASEAPLLQEVAAPAPLRAQPFAVGCCIVSMQLQLLLLFFRDFLRGGPAAPSSPDDSPVEARLIFKMRRGHCVFSPLRTIFRQEILRLARNK